MVLPAEAADSKVAVFDFELNDTSLDGAMMGPQAAEAERIRMVTDRIRTAIEDLPGYAVVDVAPVRDKALGSHLQACGGCDATFAREIGADLSVVGEVQKVSNLILNINVYVHDAEDGRTLGAGSVDIRSNTDESWRRGIDYLFRNILKKQLEAL